MIVQLQDVAKPAGARLGADQDEHREGGDGPGRARLPVPEGQALQALATVAVVFVIHRPVHRHDHMMAMDPGAMQRELYQHWVFAAAFLGASVTAFLSRLPATAARVPPRIWYAFMALGGLVFVTFRV